MAGKVIWHKRKEVGNFLNPFDENPFAITVTTDIVVRYEENSVSTDNILVQDLAYLANAEAGNPTPNPEPGILDIRSITRDICVLEENAESWLYARVAFLFFFSILITWVRPFRFCFIALQNLTVLNRFHQAPTGYTRSYTQLGSTSPSIWLPQSCSLFRVSGTCVSTSSVLRQHARASGTPSCGAVLLLQYPKITFRRRTREILRWTPSSAI